MFTQKLENVHMACDFNCHFEPEGFLKVTSGHVHCKSGDISELVQDGDVFNTDH